MLPSNYLILGAILCLLCGSGCNNRSSSAGSTMSSRPVVTMTAGTPSRLTAAQAEAEWQLTFKYRRAQALATHPDDEPLAGMYVDSVAVSGSNIYAGTDMGMSVSRDGGLHWSVPDALAGLSVYRIAASGPIVFANVTNGCFVSLDNGVTWRADNPTDKGRPLSAADGPQARYVLNVACSGSTICVTTMARTGGLYTSRDEGANWKRQCIGGKKDDCGSGLAISGSHIYVGTSNGMYASHNGGSTFARVDSIQTGTAIPGVNGIAASGETVYAIVAGFLYVSNDNGATWTMQASYRDYTDRICANGPTICTAQGSQGVSLSVDGGDHWVIVNTQNGLAWDAGFDVAMSGSTICVATSRGLSVTNDNGASWKNYL